MTTDPPLLPGVAGLSRRMLAVHSPARVKPAASADSTESNHTSATVWPNHWLSG